jgi:hypothetical protein
MAAVVPPARQKQQSALVIPFPNSRKLRPGIASAAAVAAHAEARRRYLEKRKLRQSRFQG